LSGPIKFNKKKVGLLRVKVRPKMAINIFGRRNFMQPMGREMQRKTEEENSMANKL
jgi:hypothetical protein